MKTYSNYYGIGSTPGDIQRVINNNAADNLLWGIEQVNDAIRYLAQKYYFNERTYTVPGGTIAQTQFYNLPPQVKKLINVTVTIGGVKWQPQECPTRQFWDSLNVINYYQDFPSYFFVFNNQVGIYPIPASNSNVLTLNYKTRTVDLSQADYSTGTAAITTNTAIVTGSGTTFTKSMAAQGYLRITPNATDAANGDNVWYPIASVDSATQITLQNNYTGATVTGASYTVGQVSILPEDYHDLPLYRMGIVYYTTRFPDPIRAQTYQKLWDDGEARLNAEFGSKTSSVVLTDTDQPIANPNLFARSLTQI